MGRAVGAGVRRRRIRRGGHHQLRRGGQSWPARRGSLIYVARLDVAGVNIEDSSSEALIRPEAHAAKVAAVKTRCPGVFVDAGADGIFGPGVADEDTVRELCAAAAARAALAVRDGGPIPAATPYGQMQSRLLAYHR